MAKEKILVVDDEEDILELVRYNLAREGYQVTGTLTGEDALRKVRSDTFDLIVLDLMLPGMDGLAFTKTLKNDSRLRSIPIIMLTAKGEEADIVTGLELGADDYITKPFSPKVMIARVRATLRRHQEEPQDEMAIVKIHDLEINPGRRSVMAKGDPRCSYFWPNGPDGYIPAPILWIRSAAATTRSPIAVWMSRSSGCEKNSAPPANISKPSGGSGIGSRRPREKAQTLDMAAFSFLFIDHPHFIAGRQLVCLRGHAPIFSGPGCHRS